MICYDYLSLLNVLLILLRYGFMGVADLLVEQLFQLARVAFFK